MPTTVRNDDRVAGALHNMAGLCPFFIGNRPGNMVPLKNIKINDKYECTFESQVGRRKLVVHEIKERTGLRTARWLNHIYFRNGFGEMIEFKNHLKKNYTDMEFT